MAKIDAGEDFDALVEEYGEDPGMQSEPTGPRGYMVYEGLHQPDDRVRKQRHGAGKKAGDVTKEPALTSMART